MDRIRKNLWDQTEEADGQPGRADGKKRADAGILRAGQTG